MTAGTRLFLIIGAIGGTLAVVFLDVSVVQTIIAVVLSGIIVKFGWMIISGLAQPVPEPPDPGELRKVKLIYRCSVCGTEVRMTSAVSQEPDPPRHCMDEMDLMTPLEDR